MIWPALAVKELLYMYAPRKYPPELMCCCDILMSQKAEPSVAPPLRLTVIDP
jgi:hypothetical protein